MVALTTTYVEYKGIEDAFMPPKQKGPVQDSIIIGTRQATTVRGAQQILTERARVMGIERQYSRDAVYRMLIDHKVEAIRTPSANYYFIDELDKVPLQPHKGKPAGQKNYPEAVKECARQLRREGLSQRAIARQLDVSFQTVAYWTRTSKQPVS